MGLILYVRRDCHLCEEMLVALRAMQAEHAFELEIIDVDTDDSLVRRYNEKVPVLAHDGTVICHHRLDRSALTAYLDGIR